MKTDRTGFVIHYGAEVRRLRTTTARSAAGLSSCDGNSGLDLHYQVPWKNWAYTSPSVVVVTAWTVNGLNSKARVLENDPKDLIRFVVRPWDE